MEPAGGGNMRGGWVGGIEELRSARVSGCEEACMQPFSLTPPVERARGRQPLGSERRRAKSGCVQSGCFCLGRNVPSLGRNAYP